MVKHSGAKNIKVYISCQENKMKLILTDDGIGFDLQAKMQNGNGAGLHNLEKRALTINAKITTISSVGSGTKVTIELPCN